MSKETIRTFNPELDKSDILRVDFILHHFKQLSEDAKIKVCQETARHMGLEMLRNGPEYTEKLERALEEIDLS